MTSAEIGTSKIEVVSTSLLETNAPAIMLSANSELKASAARWSWSQEVEKRAGLTYLEECAWLSRSAGPQGLTTGTAVVTGAGDLSRIGPLRWIIQAITIHYDQAHKRVPATPEIVYRAVRSGLEKAEIYRIGAVATYLMAIRPNYTTAPPDKMAEAFFHAILDHARIASSVELISICEPDPMHFQLAKSALDRIATGVA